MDYPLNILVTGAGAPGGPGILKSLLEDECINLFAGDADPFATGKYLVDNFIELKPASCSDFAEDLLKKCIAYKIQYVIPLVTKELYILSEAKHYFKSKGIEVLVSDHHALSILNNKYKLTKLCEQVGVPFPQYDLVNKYDSLKKLVDNYSFNKTPVVVKPTDGNGSRGIRIIDDTKDKFDLMFNYKPSSLYINKSEYLNILKNRKIPQLMLSEYLPGKEVTVDCIVISNKAKVVLIRERTVMREGISIAGKFIDDPKIKEYVAKIIASLPGIYGPIGFQFKQDSNGVYKILESNPRLQGTTVAARALGYNFPSQCLNLLKGKKIVKPGQTSGYSFRRYYSEVYYES